MLIEGSSNWSPTDCPIFAARYHTHVMSCYYFQATPTDNDSSEHFKIMWRIWTNSSHKVLLHALRPDLDTRPPRGRSAGQGWGPDIATGKLLDGKENASKEGAATTRHSIRQTLDDVLQSAIAVPRVDAVRGILPQRSRVIDGGNVRHWIGRFFGIGQRLIDRRALGGKDRRGTGGGKNHDGRPSSAGLVSDRRGTPVSIGSSCTVCFGDVIAESVNISRFLTT